MIEDSDVEQGPGRNQPLSELEVLGTWLRVSARVVVHEDRPGGGLGDQKTEHLGRVDLTAAAPTPGDFPLRAQAVLGVDSEHDEALDRAAHQRPTVTKEHHLAVR